jgi:hypothetical protein
MNRKMRLALPGLLLASCPLLAALGSPRPLAAAPPPAAVDGSTPTARVDCNHGQTIGRALLLSSPALIVAVSGTCHEDVNVPRDNVTIQGAGAAPQLVGSITIDGRHNVTLAGFTVSKGGTWGIGVLGDGSAHIHDMTVTDAGAVNVLINGGSVFMEDTTSLRAGIAGIFVRGGILNIKGNIVSNDNNFAGIGSALGGSISAGFQALFPGEAFLTTNNNAVGVLVEIGGAMEFVDGTITADANMQDGIRLFHGTFIHSDVVFDLRFNGAFGINLFDSHFDAYGGDTTTMKIAANAQGGIQVLGNSQLFLESVSFIHNNQGPGLIVDQSTAEIQGTTVLDNVGGDVVLTFGSKMVFDDQNQIGSPVLTQGAESCGKSLAHDALTHRQAQAPRGAEDALRRRLEALH